MTSALEIVFTGVIGAAVGGFLGVVAWRLPRRESLAGTRPRCPKCGIQAGACDNVPVVSWLVVRGRCRNCGASTPIRQPLMELVTAGAFAGIVATRGFDQDLLLELPFAAVLIAVAAIDLEHRIVPNRIVVPAAVWALAAGALLERSDLPELLLGGAAAFLGLLLAALAYPAGMGMGDVKLAGVMGLYLGASVAPALLVAFAAGALAGLVIIVREGAGGRKRGVPFAPYMALGGLVAVMAGSPLIDLYSEHLS
jgi:leader peptidase (prepilin peptidase) / N-methyltransferase